MCQRLGYNMSRRKGFDKATRREYDRLKSFGLTDKSIASRWGVSPSTLSRTKSGKQRVSQYVKSKAFAPRNDVTEIRGRGLVADDLTKITFRELQDLADKGSTPRTRKLAEEELSRLDRTGLSIEELSRKTFDRPVFYRTIKGKRVKLLLGRTKGEEAQKAIKDQLRKKGLNFSRNEYVDFGGYGGVN